jgi:hypothetical protein
MSNPQQSTGASPGDVDAAWTEFCRALTMERFGPPIPEWHAPTPAAAVDARSQAAQMRAAARRAAQHPQALRLIADRGRREAG